MRPDRRRPEHAREIQLTQDGSSPEEDAMSQAGQTASGSTSGPPMDDYTARQTGWVGWVVFAAALLILLGCFHVIQGIAALAKDEIFVVRSDGLIVNIDYTAWGWAHIIGGAIAVLVGACLLAGQMWARIIAVLVAMLSAVANAVFLPAYPLWSALMIVIDLLVIWAVTVHGSELKRPG
jgi:hypothetical protein